MAEIGRGKVGQWFRLTMGCLEPSSRLIDGMFQFSEGHIPEAFTDIGGHGYGSKYSLRLRTSSFINSTGY